MTRLLIPLLGLTQIIGYGTTYYAFPILVPALAAEFGVGQAVLFGVLAAGLALGGLVAPALGRVLDRVGPARAMAWGSLAVGLGLGAQAVAPGGVAYAVLVLAVEALAFLVLYDAAFALLAVARPEGTRAAITSLTLIAGFASTVFWPLTGWLVAEMGWRATLAIFAGLHLAVAAPVHLWLGRARGPVRGVRTAAEEVGEAATAGPTAAPPAAPVPPAAPPAGSFALLAWGLGLQGMAISALAVHMVPVLLAQGLGAQAYLAAMLMGPAQVAIRIVEATYWRGWHPLRVALISAALVPGAMLLLLLPGAGGVAVAAAFAVTFGAGQGLASIVRGSLPLALFGAGGLGGRLGRLARVRNLLGAAAPFLFAAVVAGPGPRAALVGVVAVGLGGVASLWLLRRRLGG